MNIDFGKLVGIDALTGLRLNSLREICHAYQYLGLQAHGLCWNTHQTCMWTAEAEDDAETAYSTYAPSLQYP